MENGVLKLVHSGQGKDTLAAMPTPPRHLEGEAKKAYKNMGELLCKANRLKTYMLPILEIFATAYAQFHWATSEINRKNKDGFGDGYIQTFMKTGAQNISPQVTLRDNAAATMLKCSKQFGLDPRSEKELKDVANPAQTNLLAELNQALGG